MTTTPILQTYEALRATVPGIDPAKAFSVAQAMHNADIGKPAQLLLPKLDQIVAATKAARLGRGTGKKRSILWTPEAKEYVRSADLGNVPFKEIARNLVKQFGLLNVTERRVRSTAGNLRRAAVQQPVPQMRVVGGNHP